MQKSKVTQGVSSELEKWFEDLVATLKTHQLQLETNTARSEIQEMYRTLFEGNADNISHIAKMQAQQHFVSRIIVDYLKLMSNDLPAKLAFDFNDSEVLVWAEINDDDDEMQKKLILTEAQINARYHPFGFDMSSTIVEKSDNLEIPNHYTLFK